VISFKIVISSHILSYKKILPTFLSSLERINFPKNNVLIVVGGNEERYEGVFLDYSTIFVNHNSYDHTGLIEIIENNHESEYWFSSHDTCIFGPNFLEFINKFNPKQDYTAMTNMGWLNMGLFKNTYLKRNKNYILSLKNCSKIRAILSERVFTRLENYDYFINDSDCIRTLENENIYNDDKKRNVLYFKGLDFYKYQSYEALNVMKPNYTDKVSDLI